VDQLILLQGVRDVSLLVNADEPTAVTRCAFDAAAEQAASNGGPPLPTAKQIAERLRKKWRVVLTIAQEPPEKHSHLLGNKEREEPAQEWLTDDYVAYSLRRVANRLRVTTLTRGAYKAERDAILAEDARRWGHERPLLIPSADAITAFAGDWDAALLLAGLEVGVRPSRGAAAGAAASQLDVMDWFYDEHGEQPTRAGLYDFARASNVCMSGEGGRKWSETITAWRQRRRDEGLSEPRVVERKGGRGHHAPNYGATGATTPFTSRAPGSSTGHSHFRNWRKRSDCVAWVERYIQSLPPGEHSTKREYAAWARKQDGAPSYSRFDRHGGWESVRREALKNLASRQGPPRPSA
jgi:hypothetical protein